MTEQTKPVELTVVFTTHNRAELIDESLAALAEQEWPDGTWDLVLVDNDSTDATPESLERWIEKMPVPAQLWIETAGQGPSYARNAGVRATNARSVAFVDDDDLVAPGWVASLGTALRTCDVVGSRHDYTLLNDPTLAATRQNQHDRVGSFHGIPVVSGGGMGCRRKVWEQIGGSNPDFRTGQDVDFAIRVAGLGTITPTLAADAVYHVRLRDGSRAAFNQGERFGRAWVRLHAEHQDEVDIKRLPVRRWFRRWVALTLRIKTLRAANQRLRWSFDFGYEVGRIHGTIVHRTWAGE